MREIFDEFLEFINGLVMKYCIVLVALMTSVVFLQVMSRYLPIRNPSWTEELSRYLMISFAFIGASNGIKKWNMVAVDFILERLPKTIKYGMDLIIRAVVLFFWILIAYLSFKIFPKVGMRQHSPTMGFPIFYAQVSIAIGALLCILQTVGQIINTIVGRSRSNV